ncbi:MAG: PEP-CTERM sorting domain-containing protein [Kiritimatiellae bacterium]|nr:PEP-CTERM sorting domain-containing protein [Kiritimatiellia bacterium]
MKKFIFGLLAVSACGMLSAATVDWKSGDLADSISSDITSITGYYYVIDGATYQSLSAMSNDDLVETYVDSKTGEIDVSSLKVLRSGNSGPVDATTDIVNVNMTDANGTDPEYALVIYVAKSAFGGSYAVASTANYVGQPEGYFGDDNPESNNNYVGVDAVEGMSNSNWAAVPEPTTIAFLALGLAAVGLKRKVA